MPLKLLLRGSLHHLSLLNNQRRPSPNGLLPLLYIVILEELIEAQPLTEVPMESDIKQRTEKMKTPMDNEGDDPEPTPNKKQKVLTWRPKWDVKVDALCFRDWEEFPFDLYHRFQLPFNSPRYKEVGLEAFVLMQGQQLGQASATYSRMMGAYYKLVNHCEDMKNRLSKMEKEAATHRNLVKKRGTQLKDAIQNA